jgi:hypothetical protein
MDSAAKAVSTYGERRQGLVPSGKKSAGTGKGPHVTYDLINFAFLAHAVLTTDDVVKAMK